MLLTNIANKLFDQLYVEKESDSAIERMRIVIAAVAIINDYIQKMKYDSQKYPSIQMRLDPEVKTQFQKVLEYSLTHLQKRKISDVNEIGRKCAVINHNFCCQTKIISIPYSNWLTLFRLYGSKHLIDLLATMGVCVSYNEVSIYINSLINAGLPKITDEAFIQYVFENGDVNIRTLDTIQRCRFDNHNSHLLCNLLQM